MNAISNKKYELVMNDTITLDNGTTLYRIKALKSFSDVEKGELGGYVQSEDNLSHEGDCWVYPLGRVYGNTRITKNAKIPKDLASDGFVIGSAIVYGNYSKVCGDALVY